MPLSRSAIAFVLAIAVPLLALAGPVRAQDPATPLLDPERDVFTFTSLLEVGLSAIVRVAALWLVQSLDARRAVRGGGSGAIINAAAGLMLTNDHVVRKAVAHRIELADGRRCDADLLGKDEATDISLLQTPAEGHSPIALCDSESLRVGGKVFAVGYPFGLDQTATMGVISGLGRTGPGSGTEDFIQIDAPINSGNSDEPQIDSGGWLVGVNTAISSPGGWSGAMSISAS